MKPVAPTRWPRRLLGLATLALALSGGCRCNEETLPPVHFENMDAVGPVDPNLVLAPPWQPPHVTQLDNGALLHWLHEPGSPAFHLRVLLPTAIHGDKLTAAGTAAVLEALELRLQARIRRIADSRVELRSRPGRVELAVHGRDADAERLIAAVAQTLADAGNPKLLAVSQGRVLARHQDGKPSALAAASLISRLLEQPLANSYAVKQDVVDLSRARLDRAWALLTDPRDALVIVHSGRAPEREAQGDEKASPSPRDEDNQEDEKARLLTQAIERLGSRWKAPIGFGSGKPAVTARLRHEPPKLDAETFLLTEQDAASMWFHRGKPERGGRAIVMLGRIIPTPTAKDRTLARISQRLLQEELDARLLVFGPVCLFAIRVRISPKDPILSLQRTIWRMQDLGKVVHPRNRVQQAAHLWLGARVVEASLAGEDWTSLWSESIDLAGEDREIYAALARDAQAMLELDPAEIQAFMVEWLDPQAGQPGWTWVAAGIDDNFQAKLDAGVELLDVAP